MTAGTARALRAVTLHLALGNGPRLADKRRPEPPVADPAPLQLARCRLHTQGLAAAFGECGKLTVPENPAAPDGRTVELFVARVGALSATPKPDPTRSISLDRANSFQLNGLRVQPKPCFSADS